MNLFRSEEHALLGMFVEFSQGPRPAAVHCAFVRSLEVIEEVRFHKAIELGVASAVRSAFGTDEEVRTAFARWGVKS